MGKNLHQGSRTGVIFIEYKKGDKEDIANHLSISLPNLDYKIYTAVLKNRMQETLNAIIGKKTSTAIKINNIFHTRSTTRYVICLIHL